jgi:hypothetical protein
MDYANILKKREPRCTACRLPVEVLAELHRDRFEEAMTFDALVGKYESHLSPSGLRRHMSRHAISPEDQAMSERGNVGVQADVARAESLAGEDFDPHALLESGTRTLAEMVETLAQEYKDAVSQQRPQAAERVFAKFMKAHGELAKAVKQVEVGRAVQSEFRKTIPRIIERCASTALLAILPLIRECAERWGDDVDEYVDGKLRLDELRSRLRNYDLGVRTEVAARMKAAMTEALQAE